MPAREFEEQFHELADLAYRTAYRILGSRSDAEEIAQDTLAKALQRWKQVSGHARPWICRVAANAAIGLLRKQRYKPTTGWALPAESGVADLVTRLDLQRLLLELPKRQREVVVLRYLADLSEADVARELGLSPGSIKTHAHRALAALKIAVDPDAGPERKAVLDV